MRSSTKGYTFAEMLVVLAIIMLMLAIVIPRLAFQQKGAGLKGAATEVMSALRTARRLAIKDRVVHAVIFDLNAIPTRFFVARYDPDFDPPGDTTFPCLREEPDNTDVFIDTDSDSQAEPEVDFFLYTNWEMVGELRALPQNIVVADVVRTFSPSAKFEVTRTEDTNFSGALDDGLIPPASDPSDCDACGAANNVEPEDTGLDGVECTQDQCNQDAHDAGEHDSNINTVYIIVKFQPTGTADRIVIHLWNMTEARREVALDATTHDVTLPATLMRMGYPPNMNPKFQLNGGLFYQTQNDYFQIAAPGSDDDTHYYTLAVNPITGAVMVYDYAWGEGETGDWDRKRDGD